ncbi:MAG: hypothetical protein H6570_10510 [Lewinellaceae bacterium]|nr:hypothetical protein [Lewinellaceae bacterium]
MIKHKSSVRKLHEPADHEQKVSINLPDPEEPLIKEEDKLEEVQEVDSFVSPGYEPPVPGEGP